MNKLTNDECRELTSLLGICWHEPEFRYTKDGTKHICTKCKAVVPFFPNPDFLDPRVVLREMERWNAERYTSFIMYLVNLELGNQLTYFSRLAVQGYVVLMFNKYILDDTGLLAKAEVEFLRNLTKGEGDGKRHSL